MMNQQGHVTANRIWASSSEAVLNTPKRATWNVRDIPKKRDCRYSIHGRYFVTSPCNKRPCKAIVESLLKSFKWFSVYNLGHFLGASSGSVKTTFFWIKLRSQSPFSLDFTRFALFKFHWHYDCSIDRRQIVGNCGSCSINLEAPATMKSAELGRERFAIKKSYSIEVSN